MTTRKLEESIERIVATFTEIPKISFKRDFAEALTAFAEAVREMPVDNTPQVKDWFCTVCGNKPACGCAKPPEPKECSACGCREVSHPNYKCKEFKSPTDLPAEVMEEIKEISEKYCPAIKYHSDPHNICELKRIIENLCLSVAVRGRG